MCIRDRRATAQTPLETAAGGGEIGRDHQRQHPPHPPLGFTVSEPRQHQPLPHPEYNKRLGSLQYSQGSLLSNTSPEHGRQQQVRHDYENTRNRIPNTISETDPQSSSPTKSSGGMPSGAKYENVVLRTQNLQPGSAQGLQANRYSDSCLDEKVHDMSLEESPGRTGYSNPSEQPPRPHSADPSRSANDDSFTSISALPSLQPPLVDQESEDYLLYGWKLKPEDGSSQLSSMSTPTPSQPGTLSSSEMQSIQEGGGGTSQPYSSTQSSESEARTPMNGEDRVLGSKPPQAQATDVDDKGDIEDQEEDEGLFTADLSDFSEASEAEGDTDEIDAESGEIRSYIKSWGNFPLDLSWEEL